MTREARGAREDETENARRNHERRFFACWPERWRDVGGAENPCLQRRNTAFGSKARFLLIHCIRDIDFAAAGLPFTEKS